MNIAEILKDKPQGTKLYSPVLGKCTLSSVDTTDGFPIIVRYNEDSFNIASFTSSGLYMKVSTGECVLFPSKKMRDWHKFAWQAGAFLLGNDKKTLVLFCSWASNDYTKFVGGKLPTSCDDKGLGAKKVYDTCDYDFIDLGNFTLSNCINLTTGAFCFKVEPKQPQEPNKLNEPTEPKHEFKPFEKVVVRDDNRQKWKANFFSNMIDEKKVREASVKCADNYYPVDLGLDKEELCGELFTKGAHWAINEFLEDLWHDAAEEPDASLDAWLIMQTGEDLWEVCKYGGFNADGGQTWQREAEKGRILRWCYFSDLLPPKGGEQ